MIDNLFTVTDLPDGTWSVAWPNRGKVKNNTHKKTIVDFAFESGSSSVALSSSTNKVLQIDSTAWAQRNFYSAVVVEDIEDVIAVKLDTLAQAEKFVNLMEKHILWRLLCKEHDKAD